MSINAIVVFLSNLIKDGFTGRVIFDLHKGSISKKVKKEITEVLE